MSKTTEQFAEELRMDSEYAYAVAIALIRGATYSLDGDEFKAETGRILDALDIVGQERLVKDRELLAENRALLESLKQS